MISWLHQPEGILLPADISWCVDDMWICLTDRHILGNNKILSGLLGNQISNNLVPCIIGSFISQDKLCAALQGYLKE